MKVVAAGLLIVMLGSVALAQQSQQPPPTEIDILGNTIAEQIKAMAKMAVQIQQMQQALLQMQQALVKEKARADAAEAKLKGE